MTDELKPCPCCGGQARFEHDIYQWYWIVCGGCDLATNQMTSSMDDCKPLLAEKWNRRAAGASEGPAEHCAEIIDGWQIVYAGTGPVKPVIEKHGLKIGSKLYAAPIAPSADSRDAERYRWLRRRVVMMDYSDDVSIVITAFKEEGPTGEFLDDQIDAAIAAQRCADGKEGA